MDLQGLSEVAARQAGSGQPWLEFMRYPAISVGLYALEPG